ncbi:hypothetical protein DYH09_04000 [bacterium CPR1]|nr:hypothetical protein [bacterium CPR1]
MFLVQKGKKIVLLHSYRDGAGRPRQRRVLDFQDRAALHRSLSQSGWEGLKTQLELRYPQVVIDWKRLRRQAFELVGSTNEERNKPGRLERLHRIKQVASKLTDLLDREDDPQVLRLARLELRALEARFGAKRCETETCNLAFQELACGNHTDALSLLDEVRQSQGSSPDQLIEAGNGFVYLQQFEAAEQCYLEASQLAFHQLPHRRRRLEPSEEKARPYWLSLYNLGLLRIHLGRPEEALQAFRACQEKTPCREGQVALALAVHGAGRLEEALEHYHLLGDEPLGLLNRAAIHFDRGQIEKAAILLLRGMMLSPYVTAGFKRPIPPPSAPQPGPPDRQEYAQHYWALARHLWSESARELAVRTAQEPIVRTALRDLAERGVKSRTILARPGMEELLRRLKQREPLRRFERPVPYRQWVNGGGLPLRPLGRWPEAV